MQEEAYTWSPEIEKRWRVTRGKGKAHYILVIYALTFGGGAAVIASVIGICFRGTLNPFPWDILMANFALWPLSTLVVGLMKWYTNEMCLERSEKAQAHRASLGNARS
jgi:hypothetical protein